MNLEAATGDGPEPPPLECLNVAIDPPRAMDAVGMPLRRRKTPWQVVVAGVAGAAFLSMCVGWQAAGRGAASVTATPPPGVIGFAELYVASYVAGSGGAASTPLTSFYPTAPESGAEAGTDTFVVRTAVLDVSDRGDGHWAVDVGAEVMTWDGTGYRSEPLHRYRVPILHRDGRPLATGLPMRMGPLPAAAMPAVVSGHEVSPNDPIAAAAIAFVDAHLTGAGGPPSMDGGVGAPAPLDPPPFAQITVERVAVSPLTSGDLLVHLVGFGDRGGNRLPIEHRLVVAEVNGTWRVLDPAAVPRLADDPAR